MMKCQYSSWEYKLTDVGGTHLHEVIVQITLLVWINELFGRGKRFQFGLCCLNSWTQTSIEMLFYSGFLL